MLQNACRTGDPEYVSFIARTCRLAFAFAVERAEFCFTVDLKEMKILTSIMAVRYLYATAQPD